MASRWGMVWLASLAEGVLEHFYASYSPDVQLGLHFLSASEQKRGAPCAAEIQEVIRCSLDILKLRHY